MIPARWEGAGAGLSWITMTRRRKENIHTHTHTLLHCSTITHAHTHNHITNGEKKTKQKKHRLSGSCNSLFSSSINKSGVYLRIRPERFFLIFFLIVNKSFEKTKNQQSIFQYFPTPTPPGPVPLGPQAHWVLTEVMNL